MSARLRIGIFSKGKIGCLGFLIVSATFDSFCYDIKTKNVFPIASIVASDYQYYYHRFLPGPSDLISRICSSLYYEMFVRQMHR